MADKSKEKNDVQAADGYDTTNKNASSFGSSEPTDGRKKYDWESGYPEKALRIIRFEATVLTILFAASMIFIILMWCGAIDNFLQHCCSPENIAIFKQYGYFSLSGLLGGTVLSIKLLYHSVACQCRSKNVPNSAPKVYQFG